MWEGVGFLYAKPKCAKFINKERVDNIMKIKKLSAVLLSAVLAFGMMSFTVFADNTNTPEIPSCVPRILTETEVAAFFADRNTNGLDSNSANGLYESVYNKLAEIYKNDTSSIIYAMNFQSTETIQDIKGKDYEYWMADFEVSSDKDISLLLLGNYGDYGTIALGVVTLNDANNHTYRVMKNSGLDRKFAYANVLQFVNDFDCCAVPMTEELYTVMYDIQYPDKSMNYATFRTDTMTKYGGGVSENDTTIELGLYLYEAEVGYNEIEGGAKYLAENGYHTFNYAVPTVATIGQKAYSSLENAIKSASSGDTVTLVKDVTAPGITIPTGANITIDFDGHTYTVGNPTVGSAGTETNGFVFDGGNVTLKNGTITSSAAKHLIQNYANLTLENMTLDGSNLIYDGSQSPYTVSHSNGTLTIDGTSTIIGHENGFAFDVSEWDNYSGATATVAAGAVINGCIELKNYDENATFTGKLVDGNGTEYTEQGEYTQEGNTFVQKANPLRKLLAIYNMSKVENNGSWYYPIHVYAGIDSLEYSKVGFKITASNTSKNVDTTLDSTTVYEKMNVTAWDGSSTEYTPDKLGGKYMFGHEMLFSIENWTNANTTISVTPYAVKLDGTEIEGKTTQLSDSIIKEKDSASALFREEN